MAFLALFALGRPATSGEGAPMEGVGRVSGPTSVLHEKPAPERLLRESEIHEREVIRERSLPAPLDFSPAPVGSAEETTPAAKATPDETALKQPEKASPLPPVFTEPPASSLAPQAGANMEKKADTPSLIAQVTPDTPPRRAASLRLAEEGRKLLQSGEYQSGLSRLEKAIALDARNHYAYYYLAVAHYRLAHYQESLNFLEIVGPSLAGEPPWLARVYALEGENYAAMGFFARADGKYLKALTLDVSNGTALGGLSRVLQKAASSTDAGTPEFPGTR